MSDRAESNAGVGQQLPTPNLADIVVEALQKAPELCIIAKGRIGAQPHIRYRNGRWESASWSGPGFFVGRLTDEEGVRFLLDSGPKIELEHVEDLNIWEIFDGSIPDDMELYLADCDCGQYKMTEWEPGAENWAEEHVEECEEAGLIEVSRID